MTLDDARCEDERHAKAQRHDRADRRGAGTREMGQAVTKSNAAGVAWKEADQAADAQRREREHDDGDDESAGEIAAMFERFGLQCRGSPHAAEDERQGQALNDPVRRNRLGITPQHAHRRDAAQSEQLRQREDQGDQYSQANAPKNRNRLPRPNQVGGKQAADEKREGGMQCGADGRSRNAGDECHGDDLEQEDDDHIARCRTDAAKDRDGVHATGEPDAGDLCNAHSADQKRQQANEAKVAAHAVKAAAKRRLGIGESSHAVGLRVG